MLIVGIDPGLSGAIATLNDNGEIINIIDAPTEKGKRRRIYMIYPYFNILLLIGETTNTMCAWKKCNLCLQDSECRPLFC